MDPVTAVFATFLNNIFDHHSTNVANRTNMYVQSQVVEYKHQKIGYQYQLWKIKDKSVCANTQGNLLNYSACSQAAKAMFEDICIHLQKADPTNWKQLKLKNMYCSAAVSYKPIVAKLSPVETEADELELKRQKCNLLTAQAVQKGGKAISAERDRVCSDYHKSKQK